jgi:hemoglobin-like flavoprotein
MSGTQIMTPDAIERVKSSYAALPAEGRQLSARFYKELFAAAPNLRPLFPTDLSNLQGHFEAALALVVRNLSEVGGLQQALRDLGAQHVHWGTRPEDYVTARESLVTAIGARRHGAIRRGGLARAVTAIVVPMLEGPPGTPRPKPNGWRRRVTCVNSTTRNPNAHQRLPPRPKLPS